MNIPLVRNDLIPNFRSTSPPTNRTTNKIARERSPPTQNYLSHQDNMPRNQILSTPGQNTTQKPVQSESDPFKVFVRIRPLNSKEINNNTTRKGSTVEMRDNMVFVFDPENPSEVTKKEKIFVFDNAFAEAKSTEEIYQETLTPALENMIQGFNSTIFAYGMTGAGKTYTMFGDIYNSNGGMQSNPGLVNLMVRDIFQTFTNESANYEFFMKMSYIEIYNEQIRDLLNPAAENLMVVEDPGKGVMISNLSEYTINSEIELLKHIFQGNSKRIMATTHANQFSSRSHAIIQLIVEKRSRVRDIQETYTQSKLCFVDLAGSERAATTENRGIRLQEGANINRSLLALGNCINILSDSNKKGAFVPYRDSKLTRLLKDSLGGNTRTIMLACISPASIAYEETVNTLNYASRARKIKKKVMSNIKEVELHVSQYKEIIESLRSEIGSLKQQLEKGGPNQGVQIIRDTPVGSMKELEDGSSMDALGKALFANLEEHWEISQSLKELRDLKKQNEEAIIMKMEEQQNLEDKELAQAIAKEIESLGEVMSNNEKIEMEMENNLERNMKEKKQIEEKMLAASTQYVSSGNANKAYESLERSFQHLSGEEKDFNDLQKEKIEKDHKILQLEQEINKMRRELAEKDKLIAQNQQPAPLQAKPSHSTSISTAQTHRVSKTPSSTSRAYQPSSSHANKVQQQQQPNHSYGFGQNRDYLRELKAKKAEKHGSMQDVSERASAQRGEDVRLSKDMNAEEMMEIINNRNLQDRYSTVLMKDFSDLNVQRDEKKRSSRFFKGSGLNESSTKTAANTIRQMVKNKYNQATQPVSVEELKNYAEKLKGVNFEAVQKKAKKPPKAYASPQLNPQATPNSSYYSHLTQNNQSQGQRAGSNDGHKSSKGNFVGKSGAPPGIFQYNQVAGTQGSGKKGSREGTPEKGFSEISSIVMLPNDHSPDQSVDEYILYQAVDNDLEKKKYSTVEPRHKIEGVSANNEHASPNFHLNIRYLMSNEGNEPQKSHHHHHHQHTHSTNPVVSSSKSQERNLGLTKGQSQGKVQKVLPAANNDTEYLLTPQTYLSADKRSSEPAISQAPMRHTAGSHKSKESPMKDEPPRPNTLYYLNFRRDEAKRSLSREKNVGHSVKSQTLDQGEGSMSPSVHSQSLTKHMRSTSLHTKQFGALKRAAAAAMSSLEDSNSIQNSTQRLQDTSDAPKKGANEIRTLEEARDLVRNFRVKLTSLAYVVEKNFIDEKYSQEIANLVKEYNENKYILSAKDQALLAKVEAVILQTERKDSGEATQKMNPSPDHPYKSTRSVSVNPKVATKYVTTSIKDLESRQDDSPYQIYKKSVDFGGFNDSTSSERGSNHEEKTTNANSSTGQQTKESSLLYSKNKGGLVYSSGRNSNTHTSSGNAINIYNQFAMQDIRPFQTNRDVYLSPKMQPEGEVMHSRKSGYGDTASEYSSRGKANPEVQHLIEKQKKNLEEFDKKKAKNFDIGIVDVYNTSRPSYQEARPEIAERGTERGSNRKSINMNQFE